jgi:phage terminase large subunit-like protein
MQHHGAPTGFLDWTKSSYVALYFAFEEEPPKGGCAVWAIDLDWLEQKARKLLSAESVTSVWDDLEEQANYVNGLLRQTETPVILQVNPLRLNTRMVAQQGFFLCKLYDQAAFSLILMSMMTHPKMSDGPDIPDRPVVRKLVLQRELRIEILKHLRAMNIHRASLFPGLDGLGKSLRLDLEMKVKS